MTTPLPRRRILLLDSSVLIEIVDIPFEAGRHAQTVAEFDRLVAAGVHIRLPMATVLETGAHVRRIKNGHDRRRCARTFTLLIEQTLAGRVPWGFLPFEWDATVIRGLLDGETHGYAMERSLADGVFEMGDLVIVEEWRRTRAALPVETVDVDVWTYDATLRGVLDTLRGEST